MPPYFFTATTSAHHQITNLFDFVWPTVAAMWNLRWQVSGYLNVVPNATVHQLNARFIEGSEIKSVNFKRSCITHTWNQQKETYAKMLLISTIAIYEGWIEEVLKSLGQNTKQPRTSLQFPDPVSGSGPGITSGLAIINAVESLYLKDGFYLPLTSSRYFARQFLDAMLICFRYFKELRNCDMHRGGIADQKLLDAYARFATIATPAALGMKEVPVHKVPVVNSEIEISLRGVVGFSGMMIKIIATLDAELSRSSLAEIPFIKKWKVTHPYARMLPSDLRKRGLEIARLTSKAGFPKPENPSNLVDWLNQIELTLF